MLIFVLALMFVQNGISGTHFLFLDLYPHAHKNPQSFFASERPYPYILNIFILFCAEDFQFG